MDKSTGIVLWDKPYTGSVTPTKLTDRSRIGNDGAWTNITATRLTGGLWVGDYNGSTSKIVIADSPSFDITDALTAMAWAKVTDVTGARQVISKDNTGNGANVPFGIDINVTTGTARGVLGNGAVEKNISGGTGLVDAWHHIVFKYDGSFLYLYVDGKSDATPVAQVVTPTTNNLSVWIGTWGSTWQWFVGMIGLVHIYSYALTPAQIRAIFQSERGYFNV